MACGVLPSASFVGVLAPLLPFRGRVIELSAAWRQSSDEWLTWAVHEANLHAKPLDPICPIDMAFHPNRKGARAYADAVIQALDPFLPFPR